MIYRDGLAGYEVRDGGAQEAIAGVGGQGFEHAVGVLEVIENAEAEGEPAASHRQVEIAMEIDRFDADGGIEGDLQGLNACHAVVVGGRVIDGADAAVEGFE